MVASFLMVVVVIFNHRKSGFIVCTYLLLFGKSIILTIFDIFWKYIPK